ncbi:hypothetical protein F2Q70_00010097 [Brassica cretica]|uniref:Uncharacterized protein n=1 Tax=Brassica cretica TaxID=69181 RepID=A0A8S9LZB4_BRACR|nr:hypothetical protein F2Q70_00010097 [Brassica cretica]KAF3507526.1 hypothetical protein F2Q69_00003673 [Brassica cretica]
MELLVTDDSAFVVLRDNQRVVTSRPMDSASLTMPSLPTAYAPPVSTQVKITSPPSLSDSTTVSNGDKSAAENKSSETEKQDDVPDKTKVQDSSLSHSDSTALSKFSG